MPKTSTERWRAFRDRQRALGLLEKAPRKVPKSGAQRKREHRARKRALKAEPEITVKFITPNNISYSSLCNTESDIIVVKTEEEEDPLAIDEKDQLHYQEQSLSREPGIFAPLISESLPHISKIEIHDKIIPNAPEDGFQHIGNFIATQSEIIRSILRPETNS